MSDTPDTRLAEEGGGGSARPLTSDDGRGSRSFDIGGLLIAASLLIFAWLIFSDASAYQVRRASAHFGPGIYPMIVAAGLFILGALTLLMGWKGQFPEREIMAVSPPLWITAGLFAQILLIANGGGFIIATSILFAAAARGLGRRNLLVNGLVGLAVTVFLYLLFQRGLGLALPAGPAEALINGLLR